MGIDANEPGSLQLLMGNEAIARGALEAGIGVASAYPGTPSSEVIATLAKVAKDQGLYVEWSINEKVAVEVAAAAALSGVRAITAMKQNGRMSMPPRKSTVVIGAATAPPKAASAKPIPKVST